MGRSLSILIFILLHFGVYGQHHIKGKVISGSGEPVGFCHVFNQTLKSGKVADLQGRFSLAVRKDDTVSFSYVGYTPLKIIIKSIHLANFTKITLTEDSLTLPSITIFADRYYRVPLNLKGEPIIIPGVSLINPPEPIKAGDLRKGTSPGPGGIPGGGFTLYGPITYFSRDEQEKRKAAEAYQETEETITYQKYIAQDTIRRKLCTLYKLTDEEYDEVLVRLHEFWPEIQRSYRPQEIWNWLLVHFDRTVPVVRR